MPVDFKNKSTITLFVIAASIIILTALGVGGYYLYKINKKDTPNVEAQTQPDKTVIESTSDPNVKKITPSKDDTVQVKTSDGTYISVPVFTAPPKN